MKIVSLVCIIILQLCSLELFAQGAYLEKAKLQGAHLENANLKWADLKGASLKPEQLRVTKELSNAIMPDGSTFEDWMIEGEPTET